ncbi:roadblock/LC7 domain-containing protein [Streptomyces sp. NPDC006458]|uniref:roadblock/LC7 domain-containing protein n=1 Tax=unclassified Streptomyces TaxID=2593676 RepID=UPI0004C4F184|nr:roadblock/LC7 domain-containing protein [Streptomyces sp. NRRL S-475]
MTEQQPTAETHDMTWVLNRLAQEKGVEHAVLFSSDGLVLAHSEGLHRDVADRTAASSSSLFSLGRGVGEFAPTPEDTTPRKIIIDLPGACVLVFAAGHNTVLAVSVGAEMTDVEVAVASAETIKAIKGLAPALSARARARTS